MWINITLKELNMIQEGLDLLAEKTEEELEINRAKLWAKIQRRKESEESFKKVTK